MVSSVDSGRPDTGPAGLDSGMQSDGAPLEGGSPADTGSPLTPDRLALHAACSTLTSGPAGGALPANKIYAMGSTAAIQPYVARVAQVLESLDIATVIYVQERDLASA